MPASVKHDVRARWVGGPQSLSCLPCSPRPHHPVSRVRARWVPSSMHACMHTCTRAYMHTCIHTCKHALHTPVVDWLTSGTHTCMHTYYTYVRTYTCIYMYVCSYVYTHTQLWTGCPRTRWGMVANIISSRCAISASISTWSWLQAGCSLSLSFSLSFFLSLSLSLFLSHTRSLSLSLSLSLPPSVCVERERERDIHTCIHIRTFISTQKRPLSRRCHGCKRVAYVHSDVSVFLYCFSV